MAKDAKPKPKPRKPKKKETKRRAAPVSPAKPPKSVRLAEARVLRPLEVDTAGADAAVLDRLWRTIEKRRLAGDVRNSHSARLLARGTAKVAQKLGEGVHGIYKGRYRTSRNKGRARISVSQTFK